MRRLPLVVLVGLGALIALAGCSAEIAVNNGGEGDQGGGDARRGDTGASKDSGGGTTEDCRKTPCGEGSYCDPIDHQCYMKCGSDSSCGNPYSPRCDRKTGRCVECFLDGHCGAETCNIELGKCGNFDGGPGDGGENGGDGDGGPADAGLGQITVEVAPPLVVLQANIGAQQFTATVFNARDTSVTWSIQNDPGDGTLGTLDGTGMYRTPAALPAAGQAVIRATSNENSKKYGQATVTITAPVEIQIAPGTLTLNAGMSHAFAATVMNTTDQDVIWEVEGGIVNGAIDDNGVYTAPGIVPIPAAVTIRATSEADPSRAATAVVTIIDQVAVTVTPAAASLVVGASKAFSAAVVNALTPEVTWAVAGGAQNGVVDASGIYQAPAMVPNPATVELRAYSVFDPNVYGTASITVTPPLKVTVAPKQFTLNAGLTRRFTAAVDNAVDTSVAWSVVGGAPNGTIDQAGLYAAPAAAPNPAQATIKATSNEDPTKSDTATVTVVDPIKVTVAPALAALVVGGTRQFIADVQNNVNTDVVWSVTGGALKGTIDANGVYAAPAQVPNPPIVEVRATSAADPSKYGAATVTITEPIKVTVSPATTSVSAGLTRQFVATVDNAVDQTVTWTVVGGAANGSISNTGLYFAPAQVPNPAQVTVRATSNADAGAYGEAQVTVVAPVIVTVAPPSAVVNLSRTVQFSAAVANAVDQTVAWSVTGGAANGTISNAGLYTAPPALPNPAIVEVRATSNADNTKYGSARVTVSNPVAVSVSPKTANVNIGLTQQFLALVTNAPDPTVTWAVIGGAANGTISAAGIYTAPAVGPNPAQVTVRATSNADNTRYDEATVTVVTPISVVITPGTATVNVTFTRQFTAQVLNSPNQAVTWAINGGAQNGTISAAGLYTAPGTIPNPNVFSISATSLADPTAVGLAQVSIMPPIAVSISPDSQSVAIGQTAQFTASVGSTQDKVVTWEVLGGAQNGAINTTGLFTAPGVIPAPQVVTVKATSNADPTKSDTATATIVSLCSTFAGSTFGYANGTGTAAQFAAPAGIAIATNGDLYVADTANNRIRRITPAGVVTSYCGSGTWGYNSASTACASANFAAPTGVAVASGGDAFVADSANNVIRRISGGSVTVLAGDGTRGYAEGIGTAARFAQPMHLALDAAGQNLYVTDYGNHRIRRVAVSNGATSLFAGSGAAGYANGSGGNAQFNGPYGVSIDGSGNVYVGDQNNHALRMITSGGSVSTLAGNGTAGSTDGTGPAARFNTPAGTTADGNGAVYVADMMNYVIRKVSAAGVVSTLAGSYTYGFADGAGNVAKFNMPSGVVVTADRKAIYVTDQQNAKIRLVRQGL